MNKNKITLINMPPHLGYSFSSTGNLYPSFGLLLIGTHLKKMGFHVELVDCTLYENYVEAVLKRMTKGTIFVGLSVMTTQVPFALSLSRAVKERFDIPIVWGGPHPTLFPRQTLQNKNVDIIVANEGAFTAVELAIELKHDRNLSGIKGIGFKNSHKEIFVNESRPVDRFEDLPEIDYSLIDINRYIGKESPLKKEFPDIVKKDFRIIPILTGLGCAFKCQFCINVILERRYRYRQAKDIIRQIKYLMETYNANTFYFLDEDFFLNKKRTYEFLKLVEREKLKFNWRVWSRVDHFSEDYINSEMVDRLSNIGHGSMVMGGESANQETLNYLQKGITTEQIVNSAKLLKGKNILAKYSFMVGLENEDMRQINNTIKFCMRLKDISSGVDIDAPVLFRLYPGSPIYNRLVVKYNIQMPDDLEEWEEFLINEKRINFINSPWAPKGLLQELKPMEYALKTCTPSMLASSNFYATVLLKILGNFSKLRIKKGFYKLPVEYLVYSLILKIYIHLKRHKKSP